MTRSRSLRLAVFVAFAIMTYLTIAAMPASASVAGEIVVSSDLSGVNIATAAVTALSVLANFVPRKSANKWFGWLFKMIHLGAANVRIK
jgi:hypothetical protein